MTKLTKKQIARYALDNRGDLSLKALAEKYDINLCTLRHYARKFGVVTGDRSSWDDDELYILEQYAQKKTITQVAAMLPKRSPSAVACKARSMGIEFRKYGEDHHVAKYSNDDVHYTTLLLDDGEMSHRQIAETLEVSVAFVKSVSRGIRANRPEVNNG